MKYLSWKWRMWIFRRRSSRAHRLVEDTLSIWWIMQFDREPTCSLRAWMLGLKVDISSALAPLLTGGSIKSVAVYVFPVAHQLGVSAGAVRYAVYHLNKNLLRMLELT